MERRSMLKSLGALSLGMATPALAKGEVLASPYAVNHQQVETDILIVGGGTAGVIAAIQAGRAGARTTLIESGSQLGGTTTTGGVAFPGIFHAWGKQIIGGISWELVMDCVQLNGDLLPNFSLLPDRHWKHQVTVNAPLYTLLAEEKCLEAGVDIRYYETPHQIEYQEGKWLVETVGKGTNARISCKQVIDCTGNALIASMAGFDVLREADTQPGSLVFRIGGYDYDALDLSQIPKQYHRVLRQNMLESQVRTSREHSYVPYSYVYVPGADSTTSESHTLANQQGRSTLLQLVRELRSLPGCENLKLQDLKTETAVRETYRIDGVYQLTHQDYVQGKVFEDSLSYSFYPIDLHREGKSIYQEFLKPDVVASIPLRALIPKKSRNFLVAGRCVSSDRLANSALRVQASCMGMGQAAAAAAVLACRQNTTPGEVPIDEVKQLLMEHGAIVPTK
ncbi:FAD-dependent oxidoreductase [Flavilitoribacter nigricans DSM 23189 = NBRC 102662]|uniref:FAD-dependent oxidoreductase n=1 Tax=Flavilitoribacter nigricans (strain ATCC 23147 / DSM 23189 / NBRC 102662 / NCIMB 1420 / SS-2) TaxID=1122177 RepID=A0A2D0N1I5_FLAN2|nr:FAD-dependent oxidoreductase [Flavilitoribacter nigricans DSM 23189 = NBRC 102662]